MLLRPAAAWAVVALLAASARATAADPSATAWSSAASVYLYLVPDDDDIVSPVLSADRGWLHLEGRYNYEALETASLWAGYNLAFGGAVTVDVTPKLGVVFGNVDGVAPGGSILIAWRRLALYSDGEYVIDTGDSESSFFYSWSELFVTPEPRLRTGLALQRTRLYESPRDVQWGFLLGVVIKRVEIVGYVFDPDDPDASYVLGLNAEL